MILASIAAMLYLGSLGLPALLFERHEPLPGYHVLLWGWWGILAGSIAWFANPAIFLAARMFLRGRLRLASVLSLVATLLSATSPYAKEWWFSEAAGTRIIGLGLGFRLWVASFVVSLLAIGVAWMQRRRHEV
jgi:hypothetical protein